MKKIAMQGENAENGRVAPASEDGADTRARILEAAREVFTRNPYRDAGLRMIGGAAGVRHPLIIHYFGSKIALFEEIAQALESEILSGFTPILKKIESAAPREGLALAFSLLLDHVFKHPDALKVMMLNVGETQDLKISSPGLRRMKEVRRRILSLLTENILGTSTEKAADMLLLVLMISMASFVGSSGFHAQALGFDGPGPEYEKWVAEMFGFVFIPAMERISAGDPPEVPASLGHDAGEQGTESLKPRPDAGKKSKPARGGKSELTRANIMEAATKVFSSHPYNLASIRKIGKEGGFDYALIHHYFPSKADLFEAVASGVFMDFIQAAGLWGAGLDGRAFSGALAEYLERALSYCFLNRGALGILMLNAGQVERMIDLEGFRYLVRFHSQIYEMVRPLLPASAPERKLRMWLYGIITVAYSFIGAPDYPASLLGMSPDSESFRRWIVETLLTVFLPVFSKTE